MPFLSPVSLVYAFGLLYPGCDDDAQQEIKEVFYLDELTESDEELYQLFMDFGNYLHTLDDGVELSLTHAFWYDNNKTPTSQYLSTINTYFGAETDQIDFTNSSGFAVDDVIQSTYISVDEKGTEAAAVTVIGIWESCEPMVKEITFDRPFIYTIRDAETHAIIFISIMNDPTQ